MPENSGNTGTLPYIQLKRSLRMKDIEQLLEEFDFAKETAQKNQLYYELFHKPVPVKKGQYVLSEMELGLVGGGRDESRAETSDPVTGAAIDRTGSMHSR